VVTNFQDRLDARLSVEALSLVNITLGMGSADNAECQRLARQLCVFRDGLPLGIATNGWSSRAVQFLIALQIARRDPANRLVLNMRACPGTDDPLIEWDWN
jgi:hypothetical protein